MHVRRTRASGDVEDTLRKIVHWRAGIALQLINSDADPISISSAGIEIKGLVVGRYIPERF